MEDTSRRAITRSHHKGGKQVLALDPEMGSIYTCGACKSVHIVLGDLHLETDIAGFRAIAILIDRAIGNFEVWAESAGRAA